MISIAFPGLLPMRLIQIYYNCDKKWYLTCTTSVSAEMNCEEFALVFKPEVVVRGISGGVVLSDKGYVKLKACVLLTHNTVYLPQTKPVFSLNKHRSRTWMFSEWYYLFYYSLAKSFNRNTCTCVMSVISNKCNNPTSQSCGTNA